MSTPDLLVAGPTDAAHTLVLAHGAGAPMDSPFLEYFARALGEARIRTVRFEFPYMAARRDGKRGPPNRQPILIDTWRAVLQKVGAPERLHIGGKSLGGRIASMVADRTFVRGLVCLGYPFHPPGQPERLRTAHLVELRTPALIVQGERDPFGTPEDVTGYDLSPAIRFCWLSDGDHSFKPRKASGRTEVDNREAAVAAIADFVTRGHDG